MKTCDGSSSGFSLLDNLPLGLFVVNNEFTIIFWNSQLEVWTDISRSEIIGDTLLSRFPNINKPFYVNCLNSIFEGGPPIIFSSQLHKNLIPAKLSEHQQRIQHTTVISIPETDTNGYCALFAVEDVTDLSYRLQDYKSMRNQALEELEERKRVENALREAELKLKEYNVNLEKMVEERTAKLRETLGSLQQTQDRLTKSEEKYRNLIESIDEAIWEVDVNGVYTYVSPRVKKIFGYSSGELLGKSYFDLMHEDDVAVQRGIYQSMISNQKPFSRVESKFLHKDGRFLYIETSGVPFFDGEGTLQGYRGVARDVTEHKMAEDEKTRLETQLVKSDKMASIGQLAAGVAHEINNPVGFVKSNLGTLDEYREEITTLLNRYQELEGALCGTEEPGGNTGVSEILEKIRKEKEEIDLAFIVDDYNALVQESLEGVGRIEKIVSDLKDFAHPGEDKPSCSDINKNIDSTLNIVWNEIKYKAKVIRDYGNIPEVLCYPQQLNQVFMNLLVNAAHAIEKKGEIRITTRGQNDHVEIRISDNGCGIPEDVLPRIFDPFYTTKEIGKGTGLGLNLAYNIIKKHKGTIDVVSEVGKGTTFTIDLKASTEI